MRKRILSAIIFSFMVFSVEGLSLQQIELGYKTSGVLNSNTQDIIWDVQLSINLSEGTGAEFDGNFFYITNSTSNLINKYDTMGNLSETFSIPGVSGLSDLAFDGTYMYGGNGSPMIFQMDFITKILVNTINTPVNVRHIAYDENNDAFWVGSWVDPLTLISRSGTLLNSFMLMLPFVTGTAYDNASVGGPYLWIFDRGNQILGPQLIHQFHIPSGTFTGLTHDVLGDVGAGQPNAVAGGLFSTADLIQGTFSLGGILIGTPTILFAYELMNPIPVELFSFTANYSDDKVILSWQTGSEVNNRGFELQRKQTFKENDWNMIGFVLGHGTTIQPSSYRFSDEHIPSGSYSYRLKQIDFNGTTSFSEAIEVKVPAPNEFILEQNYPNPFNPTTKIRFAIPTSPLDPSPYQGEGHRERLITLKVYDVLGNDVATIVNEEKHAGFYKVDFNAKELTSGVYFYQLRSGSFTQAKKMILIK